MTPAPRPDLLSALSALGAAFHSLGQPAMLIGGLAVIGRGIPRQTIDIDATIGGAGLDLDALIAVLADSGIEPRVPDALEFARQRQVLLLRHIASETPIDLSLAWLPFEHQALERATLIDFAGVPFRVATVADLLVLKAIAWRDRDRSDIERLIVRHHESVDLAWVRATVKLFYDALDEPERLVEFDAVVARALSQG